MSAEELGAATAPEEALKGPGFASVAAKLDAAGSEIRRIILEAADEAFEQLQAATGDSLRELMAAAGVGDMKGALLGDADLRGEDLSGIDFEGADLTNADLRDADLTGANLKHTRLDGARLEGARFEGAKFSSAELSARFSDPLAPAKKPRGVRFRSVRSGAVRAAWSGVDQLLEYFERLLHGKAKQFADHKLEHLSDDIYRLSFAVPGLEAGDFYVDVRNNQVILSGRLPEDPNPGSAAQLRLFERRVELDDVVRIASADLKDGVLIVELVREVRQGAGRTGAAVPLGSPVREVQAAGQVRR